MLGYWNRPDEQAEAFRGEWFVSGDLVHVDEHGYVIHHGRADDVMSSMGYRVSPLEVEHCLAQHPGVADVAVTEVSVRDGVTLITAFVVEPRKVQPGVTVPGMAAPRVVAPRVAGGRGGPSTGASVDPEELLAYARAHLAAYKCPRQVVFVASLPRTANGKILRRELRGLAGDAGRR